MGDMVAMATGSRCRRPLSLIPGGEERKHTYYLIGAKMPKLITLVSNVHGHGTFVVLETFELTTILIYADDVICY